MTSGTGGASTPQTGSIGGQMTSDSGVDTGPGTDGGPPPDDGWAGCRQLTFVTPLPTTPLKAPPILVHLTPARIDYAAVAADGADLRFFSGDLQAPLPYEIDTWAPGQDSFVWVAVPEISDTPGFLWMCYGQAGLNAAAAPADVWTAYAAVWHMHRAEAMSTKIIDSTGSGADASLEVPGGASIDTPGQVGGAFRFAGDQYQASTGGTLSSLQFSQAVTLEGWVDLDPGQSGVVTEAIVRKADAYELLVSKYPLDDVRFSAYMAAFAPAFTDTGAPVPAPGWHHVVGTWDHDDATGRIYLDGALWDEFQWPQYIGNPIHISDARVFLGENLAGAIDEVRIASQAMSAEWIALQYRSMTDALREYGRETELP